MWLVDVAVVLAGLEDVEAAVVAESVHVEAVAEYVSVAGVVAVGPAAVHAGVDAAGGAVDCSGLQLAGFPPGPCHSYQVKFVEGLQWEEQVQVVTSSLAQPTP